MSFQQGPAGGTGGNNYDAPAPEPTPTESGWRISEFRGRSGSRIDQVELTWLSSQGTTENSPEFGGSGGNSFSFDIPSGDYLTVVEGTVSTYNNSVRLFSIRFETANGLVSETYGGTGSRSFYFQCPSGYQITGIFGGSGSAVDALGVYMDSIPS